VGDEHDLVDHEAPPQLARVNNAAPARGVCQLQLPLETRMLSAVSSTRIGSEGAMRAPRPMVTRAAFPRAPPGSAWPLH